MLDLTTENGVDNGAGCLDGDALAGAIPAGVDQVSLGIGCLHALDQHIGILGGVQAQERGAKAGGEGRCRFGDAALGTGELGGEAGQEVVLGLLRGQLGYWRQYAKGVGGEEDHLGGVTGLGGGLDDIVDVVDGVGDPGIFSA